MPRAAPGCWRDPLLTRPHLFASSCSGYLEVNGPFVLSNYSKVKVRYSLQMSQNATTDPVVTWHQGGPGWSSSFGSWGELGYFNLGVSPHAVRRCLRCAPKLWVYF